MLPQSRDSFLSMAHQIQRVQFLYGKQPGHQVITQMNSWQGLLLINTNTLTESMRNLFFLVLSAFYRVCVDLLHLWHFDLMNE